MQLASRFASRSPVLRSERPLSDDQIRAVAPSIFAEAPHESRSQRYSYIPTATVLQELRGEGFEPFMVTQTRVRHDDRRDYTKHMIRLRHASQINGREANEIILLNSHDGTSSYQMLAVTSAIGLPLPSVRITVLPGSAVPLRLLPLLRLTVGVVGATPSTVVLPWPLVLPAGSVAVALTTVPSASGVDGVKLQLPLPSAVTCPIGLPLPSVRVTVAPGSAVPLISAPLLGLTTGAAGATESTVVLAGALVLPVGSLAVALTTVPLASGVPGVKLQLPLPSAVTWPIGLPLPSRQDGRSHPLP